MKIQSFPSYQARVNTWNAHVQNKRSTSAAAYCSCDNFKFYCSCDPSLRQAAWSLWSVSVSQALKAVVWEWKERGMTTVTSSLVELCIMAVRATTPTTDMPHNASKLWLMTVLTPRHRSAITWSTYAVYNLFIVTHLQGFSQVTGYVSTEYRLQYHPNGHT